MPDPETVSFRDTEKAYGGKAAFEKARAAGRTKLDYRQWVRVRTPEFKTWFGDWEAARGVKQLDAMTPRSLDDVEPVADKKGIEAVFRAFASEEHGPIVNANDGRTVIFPVSMAGKIERHKGFDVKHIVGAFDQLFTDAVPMTSELEILKEGHKEHSRDADAYHDYVSRFTLSDKTGRPQEYYIRFTTQRRHAKTGEGESVAHSTFISGVALYETTRGASPARIWVIDPGVTVTSAPRIDNKLSQWLEKGKSPVSPFIDPETGEPLASEAASSMETGPQPGALSGPANTGR